jgi:hypothetical protein
VLRFNDPPIIDTGFGFDINGNAPPPVGGRFAISVRLLNAVDAVTGGVGAYANDRGQITSVDQKNGRSFVTVRLSS